MELEALPEKEYYTDIQDVSRYYDQLKKIHLEDATFFYEDGEKVLEHAEFTIRKGTFMALIGASGAGKSMLIKLLLNLATVQKGHLYLGTEAGRTEIDAGMRALFAYAPQGNLMLSGLIRENIVFGNRKVAEAEMKKVAEIACHGMINQNGTGRDIWQGVSDGKSVDGIATKLTKDYEVDFEKAKQDTEKMIGIMREAGILEE